MVSANSGVFWGLVSKELEGWRRALLPTQKVTTYHLGEGFLQRESFIIPLKSSAVLGGCSLPVPSLGMLCTAWCWGLWIYGYMDLWVSGFMDI